MGPALQEITSGLCVDEKKVKSCSFPQAAADLNELIKVQGIVPSTIYSCLTPPLNET